MLQPSAFSGLLFLAGVWAASGLMAFGGVCGSVAGVAAARWFAAAEDDVRQGAYGFNGALVGIALLFFLSPGKLVYLLVVAGGVLSSALMRGMLRWGHVLPPLTAPFVLSAWIMLAVAWVSGLPAASWAGEGAALGSVGAVLRGLGQVMFQGSWLSGLLFATGLALHSHKAMVWALIGSGVGLVAARLLGFQEPLAVAGVFGFNAALAGVALAGKPGARMALPLAGALLTVPIIRGFQLAGLPALTAPFVLATWLMLALARPRKTKAAAA